MGERRARVRSGCRSGPEPRAGRSQADPGAGNPECDTRNRTPEPGGPNPAAPGRILRTLWNAPADPAGPTRGSGRPARQGRSLVEQLLQKDESRRLGLMAGGVADIQRHPFFTPIDWVQLGAGALRPPFLPDAAAFAQAAATPTDGHRVKADLRASMAGDRVLTPREQLLFDGF